MAGFLDKNNRIVDMILTMEGKRLLASGDLQFVYFALFDDEVDYDPYISQSGSLTAVQLSGTQQELIEDCLVKEAVSGYRLGANASGSDFTNVHQPLFTMKQGADTLPRLSASDAPSVPATLQVMQQKRQEIHIKTDTHGNVIQQLGPFDKGYDRYSTQDVSFNMTLLPLDAAPDKQHQNGILIRVYQTGSEGLIEINERRASNNDLSFNNDLVFHLGTRVKTKNRGS